MFKTLLWCRFILLFHTSDLRKDPNSRFLEGEIRVGPALARGITWPSGRHCSRPGRSEVREAALLFWQKIRLQVFVDASPSAFGAVACFVNNNEAGFVIAKSRVAPLKIVGREKPTIPLMELMAALLGVKLATTITKAMKKAGDDFTEVTMWCDNQPVLF